MSFSPLGTRPSESQIWERAPGAQIFRVWSCLKAQARPRDRPEEIRGRLDKERHLEGKEEKAQGRRLLKKQKRAFRPGDTGLQPLPASPSGSLSPSPGPFSPPLLASLLITLAPSHSSGPPGPTRSPWSDPNRHTHVLMPPPTGLSQHRGCPGQTMLSLNRSVAHTRLAHALEHKTWNRCGDLGKNRAPV